MKKLLFIISTAVLLMSFSSSKLFFLNVQDKENVLILKDQNDTFFKKPNNITFLDAFSFDLEKNKNKYFDLIGCFQDNYWASNIFYPWQELMGFLKQDSQVIISIIPKESYHYLLIDKIVKKNHWQRYIKDYFYDRAYSIEDFQNYLSCLNIKIGQFQIQKNVIVYEDISQFKDSIRQNLKFLIDLPTALQKEFLEELSLLVNNKCLVNNKIIIPYKTLNINFKVL
jgi:hypothetical protein